MSNTFIEESRRRFFRLKHFFRPYPSFELEVDEELEKPVHFKSVKRKLSSRIKSPQKFKLEISPLILEKNSPEWVEASLLKLAKTKAWYSSCGEENPSCLIISEIRAQLEELFETAKLRKAKELEAKAKLIETAEVPNLEVVWNKLRQDYFPDNNDIDDYIIRWSNRKQTRSLASCSVEHRRVVVASAMKHPEGHQFLEALIYHEMCHAILGPPKIVKGRRIMHGREFKALERRHPQIDEFNKWVKNGGWERVVKLQNNNSRTG